MILLSNYCAVSLYIFLASLIVFRETVPRENIPLLFLGSLAWICVVVYIICVIIVNNIK